MLNFLLELCPFWGVKTFILPNFVKTLIERRVLLVFYAGSEIIQQNPHSFKNFLPKLVEGCENILFKNKKQLPFMGTLWLRTLSMSFNLGLSFYCGKSVTFENVLMMMLHSETHLKLECRLKLSLKLEAFEQNIS